MIESVNVAEMSDACWSLRYRGLPSSNISRTLRALQTEEAMANASINTSHFELVARWAHNKLHITSSVRHESMICIPLSYKGMLCFLHSLIHSFPPKFMSLERNPEKCHWMLRPSRQFSELAFLPRPSKQASTLRQQLVLLWHLVAAVRLTKTLDNKRPHAVSQSTLIFTTNSFQSNQLITTLHVHSNVSWHDHYYVQSPSWANLLFTIKEEQH
jgi:hypothetical protein